MAQTSTVGLAQGVRVEKLGWYSSELVDNVDAQAADEVIDFLLCLRVQAQPRRLQGVAHEQTVGRVESATLGAQVLGRLVGLCCRTVTVPSKESLGQTPHDQAERAGLADAATSEPDRAVVVGWRSHWQHGGGLFLPRLEALLHGECQESHGVDLLLGAAGIGDELPSCSRRAL